MTTIHLPQLDSVRIASPCDASWESMRGDERVRHCDQCDLNVYNLSGMTRDEATRLVAGANGRLCVRFYQRHDGTIITRDCPVGLARVRERTAVVWRRVAAAAALVLAATPAILGRHRGNLADRQPFRAIAGWFAPPAPPPIIGRQLMGDVAMGKMVCPPGPGTTVNTTSPASEGD